MNIAEFLLPGMKTVCRKILQYYLKILVKAALAINRPIVAAVAGSANKQFFKEQVKDRLSLAGFFVRATPKNFNTEIGLPLAILDLPSGYNSFRKWTRIIFRAPLTVFKKMPQVLVLELGISDRGNMEYLLSLVSPKIVVISDITQRYLEGFADLYELVEEYEYLVRHTKPDGLVILNYDNLKVRELARKASAPVSFFSLDFDSKIKDEKKDIWRGRIIERGEDGQKIEVWHKDKRQEYKINRFGQHHIQALLAGLIVEEKIGKLKR
jgi:UDP-N-acetylmuramoyl-tripeptide--D-alanyl-D-alanine ligase